MNILELPSDALIEIWKYLSGKDIVRFGWVCKSAENISWSSIREIKVQHPDLLDSVLSRDLSRIRTIEVFMEHDNPTIERVNPDKYENTLKKFPNLANGATSLSTLVLVLTIGDGLPEMEIVADTVAKLTNLSMLHLAVNTPRDEFDLGEAFKNHLSLTRLGLYVSKRCSNFSRLTQLKTLDISSSSFRKDGPLIEISTTLTNLKELIIGDMELVSPENIDILSGLTNLEAVRVEDCHSLNFLLDLPKLSELGVSFSWAEESDLDVVLKLSNLTALEVSSWRHSFSVTHLTNLRGLSFIGQIETMDFSAMPHLTHLAVYPHNSVPSLVSRLPPNIQYFSIPTKSVNANEVETISNYPTLSVLNVRDFETEDIQCLSRLTKLESVDISQIRPALADVLQLATPNLKFLRTNTLHLADIPYIHKFTQLCSFRFNSTREEDPKQARTDFLNAPFLVIHEEEEQYQ